MNKKLQNINIKEIKTILTPETLKANAPLSQANATFIYESRETVKAILNQTDKRKLIITGPCSIHDTKAALDYAKKLKACQEKANVKDKVFLMMRVYFEKPRTTIGWKGLINDPDINQTYTIEKGLSIARDLLLQITELGVPIASEILDPITPQYLSDLISWGSIGARTTESQIHREMASGLSMPIGFKNTTNGQPDLAINAMKAAQHEHSFIGTNKEGQISIVQTTGNPWTHLILRGGDSGPNYDPTSINDAIAKLKEANLNPNIIVDCSHGNSRKKHENQPIVFNNVLSQIQNGNDHIMGMMLESNLEAGNQPMQTDQSKLEYGVSITDSCIDWKTTEELILNCLEKS